MHDAPPYPSLSFTRVSKPARLNHAGRPSSLASGRIPRQSIEALATIADAFISDRGREHWPQGTSLRSFGNQVGFGGPVTLESRRLGGVPDHSLRLAVAAVLPWTSTPCLFEYSPCTVENSVAVALASDILARTFPTATSPWTCTSHGPRRSKVHLPPPGACKCKPLALWGRVFLHQQGRLSSLASHCILSAA